tara:strand:- start:46637 stop:47332 length:696 start_codon:yes stop_codon:yes gene_type:complete
MARKQHNALLPSGWTAIRAGFLVALLLAGAAAVHFGEADLRGLAEAAAAMHPMLLFALYVVAVLLLLPLSPFALVAGFSLGFWQGAGLALAALNIGSLLAFWIGKYLLRDRLQLAVASGSRLRRALDSVSADRMLDIVLLRLHPVVPFNLHSYLYGACNDRMSLVRYLLGTFVGSLPMTVLLVYLGVAGRLLFIEGDDSTGFSLLIVAVATLCTVLLLCNRQRLAPGGRTQ